MLFERVIYLVSIGEIENKVESRNIVNPIKRGGGGAGGGAGGGGGGRVNLTPPSLWLFKNSIF